VELGEIEETLREHPEVRDAVVTAERRPGGEVRLIGYVIPAGPTPLSAGQLREWLQAKLPPYMVPITYVQLQDLPLTSNGKLDRRALPAPEELSDDRHGYEPPVGETEILIARIWAETLQLERVGRHDNFFELGGHSLLAVKVIERMRREKLQTDVRTLFTAPTLRILAEAVGEVKAGIEVPPNLIPPGCRAITPEMLPLVDLTPPQIDGLAARVPGGIANVQDIYPLAPLQDGILFHHLMTAEGDPYLQRVLLSFNGRARLDAFLQALQMVIDRHDILRTAILWEDLPEPVQVVWRQATLIVEEISLNPDAGEIAEQLRARFDPRHYRLDVRHAPLVRAVIAHDPVHDRWILLQLSHHLVDDYTSLKFLFAEIQVSLQGRTEQLAAPLPFRNLVAQARLGMSREEHETFFRKLLGDVEEPTVPFGLTDVQGDGSGVEEVRREVDTPLARRLRDRARALGVSAASLFHLAWAHVLARGSGRMDVAFGTVLFGRMQGGEETNRAMGLFINTLPIRIRVGKEGMERSVRQTHELLAELIRHEHASLALAQRCSAVAAPTPLFNSLLNYRHSSRATAPSPEALLAWQGIEVLEAEERSNYPLALSVDDLDDGFAVTVQAMKPIDPGQVCEYLQTALEGIINALEMAPTAPAELALLIAQNEMDSMNSNEIDRILDQLEHLSEEEAQAILTGKTLSFDHRRSSRE
jgi:hypothetical protein